MSDKGMPSAVREGKPGSSMYPESSLGETVPGISTGREVDWEPLVDYRRNGVSETTIHGAVAWAHGDEVIHSFGGNVLCYGRSMMKPFMLKAFTDEFGYGTTFPQVICDGKKLGGTVETVKFLREQKIISV